MNAVNTELSYVQSSTCGCGRPIIYTTMWDILCNQLFTQLPPPGISEDGTFQEVKVWNEGTITMTKTTAPYTFTIVIDTDTPPKASDIILFGQNSFYIIGAVSASGTTYTCTGCVAIDVSIIGAYADMVTLNAQAIPAESGRVDAENGRVAAENGRVEAESGRVAAESTRAENFAVSQEQRALAYQTAEGTENGSTAGDGSRWGAFKAAESARVQQVAAYFAPWIVEGKISEGQFVADDETDLPTTAKSRWDEGRATYLTIPSGRVEAITAIDTDYLYTASWKWKYTEE